MGIRYRHQGRTRKGVDCAGIIINIAKKFGLPHEDIAGYSQVIQEGILERHLKGLAKEIPLKNLQPAEIDEILQPTDIVLMRFFPHKHAHHIGIVTDKGVIHCNDRIGRVVECRLDTRRVMFAFRIF